MEFHKYLLEMLEKNNVTPTTTKIDNLKRSNNSVREAIKSHFKKIEKVEPIFYRQGSLSLNTIVLPEDGEIDLDDGVYIQGYENLAEIPTPKTIHSWIHTALEGRTNEAVQQKNTCVRLVYANNYHIDLPIYFEENGVYYLGKRKDNEWIESDARKFKDWFYNLNSGEEREQMRRIIKYLKIIKDKKSIKLPGILITALVGENFNYAAGNDPKSLKETLNKIIEGIGDDLKVLNPVDSTENLASRLITNQKEVIIKKIAQWNEIVIEAESSESIEKSHKLWKKLFGNILPGIKIKENANNTVKSFASLAATNKVWAD